MMTTATQPRDRSSGHIVVVDDDGMFRESLVQNLCDAGYVASAFADGRSAIEHLSAVENPDMILLDWKMPGMTGIEVLRELRQLQMDTPVVFLTVLSDQIYEEAGLLGGAVDFIEKSRSFSIISRRIELILDGYKGTRIVPSPPAPAPTPAPKSQSYYQQGKLLLQHDGNRAFWGEDQVNLTLTEFQIVCHLVQRTGQDIQYRDIYDLVHGERFIAGNGEFGFRANVRAFIKRIRQKFRDIDPSFSRIENYPGFGYRWRGTDEV